MLAISRGLMASPRLILLDEPSLGLAPLLVRQIFDIIKELRRMGRTILLVEQMANLALRVADRAYILEQGKGRPARHSARSCFPIPTSRAGTWEARGPSTASNLTLQKE